MWRRVVPPIAALAAWSALAGAQPAAAQNPCAPESTVRALRCPDLVMKRPADVEVDVSDAGRRLLRSTSSIDSVGRGPIEIRGRRVSGTRMRVRQVIHRFGGRPSYVVSRPRASLVFKPIPGQGGYWKLLHAASLQIWRVDAAGRLTERARRSPKLAYCLRDLKRTLGWKDGSPRREVYPGCNRNPRKREVTLGTSVGWSDIYPAPYHEQYVDVSGLRGRFALVHVADPRNVLFESDETNNRSRVTVSLPSGAVVG